MVITCATGKDIISIVAVDGVITAIAVNGIVIIGTGDIIMSIRLLECKSHLSEIFGCTISELQIFNTTVVIIKVFFDNYSLRTIIKQGND